MLWIGILRNMALVDHSSSFVFLHGFSLLSLAFCYSTQAPNSLCFLERYMNFNVERINKSAEWHQSNMIKQITNYMMIRGLTCGLKKSTSSSYCSQICAPLTYTSTRVYLHAPDVMIKCQRPLCSSPVCSFQSRIPPCRSLVFSPNMALLTNIPKLMLKFTLPAYLEFNITIWKVISKRGPLAKPKCKNSAYLALYDSFTINLMHVRPIFCGNCPIQNIASPVQSVYLCWKSYFSYKKLPVCAYRTK